MCLLLLVTVLTSLSLGLMCSTFGKQPQTPAILTFSSILSLAGMFPLVRIMIGPSLEQLGVPPATISGILTNLLRLSPVTGLANGVEDTIFSFHPEQYWIPVAYTFLVGLLAITAAIWRVPRIWQDGTIVSNATVASITSAAPKVLERHPLQLDRNPIAWLVLRQSSHWSALTFVGFIYALLSMILLFVHWINRGDFSRAHEFDWIIAGSNFLAVWIFNLWIANEAGRQLLADRRSGTIELQLVTPLTGEEFVAGHLAGIWGKLRVPVFLLILGAAAMTLVQFVPVTTPEAQFTRRPDYLNSQLLMQLLSWVTNATTFWALALTSLEGALSLKNGRIALRALALVKILPTVAWLFFMLLLGLAFSGLGPSSSFGGEIMTWFMQLGGPFLSIANAVFWGFFARRRLLRYFRELAGRPLGTNSLLQTDHAATLIPPPFPIAG